MHAPEWIGIISPVLVLGGAAIAAVAKLTRMTVALEDLGRGISELADRVGNHEGRIGELERNARGRHRYR